MTDHEDDIDVTPTGKVVTFNWMQPKHGGFLVIADNGEPIKAFSTYFEMEHDCNMKMRQEAGIIGHENERMPNIVSPDPPPNPKATHLTDEVHTQPSRWRLGQGIVDLASRAHR